MAMDKDPAMDKNIIMQHDIRIAFGKFFFGFFTSVTCTEDISIPAIDSNIPMINIRWSKLFSFGRNAAAENVIARGFPENMCIIPNMISIIPGSIAPKITPEELRKEDNFMLLKLRKVAIQSENQTTIITNSLLEASIGFIIYAMVDAINANTAGNHGTFANHCINIAISPHLGPKASFTHKNTPPFLGHPEASSAATSADGIKKQTYSSVM